MSAMGPLDDFERQLMQALEHADAPAGFAERVMERALSPAHISKSRYGAPAVVAPPTGAKVLAFPRARNVWMSGAIAAALLVGAFVGVDVHRQHERERATQEFEMATQIEARALEHTRRQLQRAGVPLD